MRCNDVESLHDIHPAKAEPFFENVASGKMSRKKNKIMGETAENLQLSCSVVRICISAAHG